MAELFGRAAAFWRSRFGKHGSLFLIWFGLWVAVAVCGSDNSLAATYFLLLLGAMALGFYLRSWWAEAAQVPAPEDSFRDWLPSALCSWITAAVSLAGVCLSREVYSHFPGLLYAPFGGNGPYWTMAILTVVPPVIVWWLFWKHWSRLLAADASQRPAEAKSILVRVDRFLARVSRIVQLFAYVFGALFAIAVASVSLWLFGPWTIGDKPTGPGVGAHLREPLLPVLWLCVAILVVIIFVNIVSIWDFIIDLIHRPRPLEDEKAHGSASRARPEQTAIGALGSSRTEPVHTQRSRD